MGFFSNLFGGGSSILELPHPHRAAPRNIGDAAQEFHRLFECLKRIIEDSNWYDNNLLDPFIDAYKFVNNNCNKTGRISSLYRGGDLGVALYNGSNLVFAAFSPFYDGNERFYRPFGLISSSSLIGSINPDNMKFIIYYNPDGESVLVDYVNRIWIDGRNLKVYTLR